MNATLPPPTVSNLTPPPSPGPSPTTSPRLVRPRHGRRIGGVCAGIADRFGWSRTTVRVIAVLSVFVPGPQVLAYVIAWVAIPTDDEVAPGLA